MESRTAKSFGVDGGGGGGGDTLLPIPKFEKFNECAFIKRYKMYIPGCYPGIFFIS